MQSIDPLNNVNNDAVKSRRATTSHRPHLHSHAQQRCIVERSHELQQACVKPHATQLTTPNSACGIWDAYYQLQYSCRPHPSTTSLSADAPAPPAAPAVALQLPMCRLLVLFAVGWLLCRHCIHGALAAPQSCVLCDKEDLIAKDPSTTYEEFLFEHQVTRQDAINSLKTLNESFYKGPSAEVFCKSVSCSHKVMKYCLGPQFINDHCWCELGHTDEGLPFVPHICYVGEKVYTASVGSCFFYEEVKDCCCASALAKQWRHISGATQHHSAFLSSLGAAILLTRLV